MKTEELFELYLKERDYERKVFGEYKDRTTLNLASFILFLEKYVEKIRDSYSDKWEAELPEWLIGCREVVEQGTAPSECYENLVKLFALTGAALETFSEIDVSKWREQGIKVKWIE